MLFNAGVAYAATEQDQKALAIADEIQRTRPDDTIAQNVAVPMIRAITYLMPANPSRKSPEKAIDLMNTVALYSRDSTGLLFVRGLAYLEAGRYGEAHQDLQKLVTSKSAHGPDAMIVIGQLELGRVYTKQGDTAQARIAYQNFLASMKDADPDVPIVRDAKAEYTKLQ